MKRKLTITNQENPKKKVTIPSKFINHILSLGFNEEDAANLYEHKDDWMGISTGGKLLCAQRGCKFHTKVSSGELFEHCRQKHEWKDHPCKEDNCNFVAYSKTALVQHSTFHSKVSRKKYEFLCRRLKCKASFGSNVERVRHENIHDNVLLKCVFCPYTCVLHKAMSRHYCKHFNIRKYECDGCEFSFYSQNELNVHYQQKHSGETTKCPICDFESTMQNTFYHLETRHKVTGCHWDRQNFRYILPADFN